LAFKIEVPNVFLWLWRDRAGSSLIEYSFLITITVVLVLAGVAAVGIWASGTWSHLLAALG
jgi:Flp pilus assembly pilin Flp